MNCNTWLGISVHQAKLTDYVIKLLSWLGMMTKKLMTKRIDLSRNEGMVCFVEGVIEDSQNTGCLFFLKTKAAKTIRKLWLSISWVVSFEKNILLPEEIVQGP